MYDTCVYKMQSENLKELLHARWEDSPAVLVMGQLAVPKAECQRGE